MAPRGRARAVCTGLLLATILAPVAVVFVPAVQVVHAASPSPGIVSPGDTRSEGEGAGLVGSPVLVALAVIALGAGAAGLTIIYLRLRSD